MSSEVCSTPSRRRAARNRGVTKSFLAAVAPPAATVLSTQCSDRALFAAAQHGDYAAFEAIVQRYHGRLWRIVRSMLKSPSDAEEVVQETFLNVFRKLHTFANESSPKTWLVRIAVNATLMRLRAQRRRPLLSLEDSRAGGEAAEAVAMWQPSPWARLPDDAVLTQELQAEIISACDRLPEKYRLVLLLRDVEGHSLDDTANTLGLTIPTVKARLHRARLFVRGRLDDYFHRR